MHFKFKKHDKVVLLVEPDAEYIEYEPDFEGASIKKGMIGEVNIILPNGKYHIRVLDGKGNTIAYVPLDEEEIGPLDKK